VTSQPRLRDDAGTVVDFCDTGLLPELRRRDGCPEDGHAVHVARTARRQGTTYCRPINRRQYENRLRAT